jgi:hypothetical protein
MECKFVVGQKVVCVDADPGDGYIGWADDGPVEGHVYTITSVHDHDGDLVVWLAEIERHPMARRLWGEECGYAACRFRPVVTRKTDISIFTAILNGHRIPEDA